MAGSRADPRRAARPGGLAVPASAVRPHGPPARHTAEPIPAGDTGRPVSPATQARPRARCPTLRTAGPSGIHASWAYGTRPDGGGDRLGGADGPGRVVAVCVQALRRAVGLGRRLCQARHLPERAPHPAGGTARPAPTCRRGARQPQPRPRSGGKASATGTGWLTAGRRPAGQLHRPGPRPAWPARPSSVRHPGRSQGTYRNQTQSIRPRPRFRRGR